jgi:sugar transferase (PEP-CTERM system associated)
MIELLRSPRRLLLFLFEATLLALAVVGAAAIRLGVHEAMIAPHLRKKALLYALVVAGAGYYAGLYDRTGVRGVRSSATIARRWLAAVAVATPLLFVAFYAFPQLAVGRGIFLGAVALTITALPAWRLGFDALSSTVASPRRVLVLGTGELAAEIREQLAMHPELGDACVGLLARDRGHVDEEAGVIGTYGELFEFAQALEVDAVVVAFRDRRGTLPVEQLLELKLRGVECVEGTDYYERIAGKVFVGDLKASQVIFASGYRVDATQRRLKRLFDVVVAGLGLVLAAPLMALVALAVRLDSPGAVLYRQERAGEFGKPFTILKFRSMRIDAEKHGAQFAADQDPRITKVGNFIRKTRLDELPQLWNVLVGEMSMVGPRPERPVFLEKLEQRIPFFKQRLYVKPGVTGHAQVRCRYGASAEDMLEKLQYDLYYIQSQSLLFDLSILVDTVKVVLLKIGAR